MQEKCPEEPEENAFQNVPRPTLVGFCSAERSKHCRVRPGTAEILRHANQRAIHVLRYLAED